jgi:hypothetical protein
VAQGFPRQGKALSNSRGEPGNLPHHDQRGQSVRPGNP